MRVRPGRLQVHVYGQGTGEPDADCGPKCPNLGDEFPGQMERNKNRKKSVEIAGHRNSDDVWPGMTVGSDRETQAIRSQHGEVRSGRKRKPEDGWTHGVEIR